MGRKNKGANKAPKSVVEPRGHGARQAADPSSYLAETPVWVFASFDWGGPWGLEALRACNWQKHIFQHLCGYETMLWATIVSASGGKRDGNGTNNHPIPISGLSKQAQRRLDALGIKAEEVFSLRLEGSIRVYGLREGRVLKLLWFDPFHGDESQAVCPSQKRRT